MSNGVRLGFGLLTPMASRQFTGTGDEFINQRIPGHVDHAHAYIHKSIGRFIASNR